MERDGQFAPDAASIKPVSSLRAKFEGLQTQNVPKPDAGPSFRNSPVVPRALESFAQSPITRASLDFPRPLSPRTTPQHAHHTTNVNSIGMPSSRASESPTRPTHQRPKSMILQSSPQLTPSVQIESPRSPPRMYPRSPSRSPERLDGAPVGKVRELVSQHASRSNSVSPMPTLPNTDARSRAPDAISNGPPRSRSPVPPPINRAEKPKIPAKSQHVATSYETNLAPVAPRQVSAEARISPFSTPPSSDEDASTPNVASVEPLNTPRTEAPRPYVGDFEGIGAKVQNMETRQKDPRLAGFSSLRMPNDKKDPRALGFSPTDTSRPTDVFAKKNNEPAKIPSSSTRSYRDPRELGFSPDSPSSARGSLDMLRSVPPLPRTDQSPKRQIPLKDPRQYGFSNSKHSPPREERAPDLPQRQIARIPPPRPSEDSKRPVYRPGLMQEAPRSSPQPIADVRTRQSFDVPRQVIATTSDVRFPPPPKRNTFEEEDLNRGHSLAIPQHQSSVSRRRSFDEVTRRAEDSDEAEETRHEPILSKLEYPDATQTNRRPPMHNDRPWQVNTKCDGKVFDVCGRHLCMASYQTRVIDLSTGDTVVSFNHGETIKSTATIFKPGIGIDAEGKRLWIGNNAGDLQEIDIESKAVIATSMAHNKREIVRILRHQRNLWTLDEEGKLFVWPADETGVPNLKYSHVSYKLAKPATYSMIVKDKLWAASGKEIRVYQPGNDSTFNVLKTPLSQPNIGDISCGTSSGESGGRAYFGHVDGKISIYSCKDYTCLATIKVSDYKINGLTFVDNNLWAVFKTGKVYVYDTSVSPWRVKKDWQAHQGPAMGIMSDPSSVWTLNKLQVVTTGHDQHARLWDGMLEDDWIETAMQDRAVEYCSFREVKAAITTWNCGATNPLMLKSDFIADSIHCDEAEPPEILVFGFQEVVDLEDRTVTAKSLLGFGKKKNDSAKTDQYQSRVYREWRDYLARLIAKYIPHHVYSELSTSSLVGLFQCVFIRQSERRNVTHMSAAPIKTGMGGHYGNKGALLTRFVLDDSSLVFINCHLAAGQTHTAQRNNDVATILEFEALPSESDLPTRSTLYVGGGDGSQILDHEIVILNGDLNYRIDAIPRDTVVKHIQNNNLAPLLERDQINVSRRRVAGFRLAPFTELPLTFAPTYKYDVGTDRYDTSDKKRAPAWCDRILYRGPASSTMTTPSKPRVRQLEYRRHDDEKSSDHRPVSGLFKLQVKRVDVRRQRAVMENAYRRFEDVKKKMAQDACLKYLVDYLGVPRAEAERKLLAL